MTFWDPAVAVGAFTVGAISQGSWNLAVPPLEGFSSTGPTHDGRIKPDLTGMDRVSAHLKSSCSRKGPPD